ncbi:hypothetical protein CLSA_c17340 [Clostridium saccharobutylicum DSM 13864]|uniref:Transposase n=2 Tax=Clostridium saccharobutylicum TaxID=169679 RepID=U5MQC6_CLOSA|nr:hypothetical protein CLSA_c17340 [Clostridium saccharobutylicum DSM 13864]
MLEGNKREDEKMVASSAGLLAEIIDDAEAKGIKKGIEKERISIARKLLKKGQSIDLIMEITELTKDKMDKLQ